MIRGLYSAGSALETATRNQELLAENLAHASTPGYRRQGISFELLAPTGEAPEAATGNLTGMRTSSNYISFAAGPLQQTGNQLDLALSGEGFFTLDGPNGPVYTRNGSFEINAQGELQSKSGLKVRGQGGQVMIPQNTARIDVTSDGVIMADNAEVGRLQLAQFGNLAELRRVGPTLFEGPAPQAPAAEAVRVVQGFREGSNIQVVQEMVAMLVGMRQYEAAERAMRALGESLALNTRPQA